MMQTQHHEVASFVSRLMSLSAQELHFLGSDSQLMQKLAETQLLLEAKLHNKQLEGRQDYLGAQHQQQHQQQQQQQQMDAFASRIASQLQMQLPSPANLQYQYQLALMQHQQQQQYHHYQQHPALDLSGHQEPGAEREPAPSLGLAGHGSLGGQAAPEGAKRDSSSPSGAQSYARRPKPLRARRRQPEAPARPPDEEAAAAPPPAGAKRYKGEFDEPSWTQVDERLSRLAGSATDSESYHERLWKSSGVCACTLGSQFCNGQSSGDILRQVHEWSRLDTRSRVEHKWPLEMLPKDIPLNCIKKFEDLRREASNGRADFGGASKRKPLGIRSTRQFLLILYCLWGHPGRRDEMQREGYCPHCFAKIRKSNEQSTLVRVVNHFNMKHRLGTNPRMASVSPQLSVSHTSADNHAHQQQPDPRPALVGSPADAASRASTPLTSPGQASRAPNSPNSTPEAAQTLAELSQSMWQFGQLAAKPEVKV